MSEAGAPHPGKEIVGRGGGRREGGRETVREGEDGGGAGEGQEEVPFLLLQAITSCVIQCTNKTSIIMLDKSFYCHHILTNSSISPVLPSSFSLSACYRRIRGTSYIYLRPDGPCRQCNI